MHATVPGMFSVGELIQEFPIVDAIRKSNNMTLMGEFCKDQNFFAFSFVRHPFER